jgi:hypothetical protein
LVDNHPDGNLDEDKAIEARDAYAEFLRQLHRKDSNDYFALKDLLAFLMNPFDLEKCTKFFYSEHLFVRQFARKSLELYQEGFTR